jgi:hypothetical protein
MPKFGAIPPNFGLFAQFLLGLKAMKNELPDGATPSPVSATKASLWAAVLGNALIASIFTSTAYLVGVVFQQQYMKTLKFNYELYPKSSAEYFLYSFIAFFQMFPAWLTAASNGFKIIVLVGAFAFFLVLVNYLGNRLGESKWMKRRQEKLSGNAKLRILGPFLYVPALTITTIFYVPLFFAVIMVIPVAIGEIMGKKQAEEDAAHYAKGCDIDPKEGYYCTLITESGKKVALGFIVDASSEYVAIVENGRSRSIPIKDKEFSQYVAGDTKSAESN